MATGGGQPTIIDARTRTVPVTITRNAPGNGSGDRRTSDVNQDSIATHRCRDSSTDVVIDIVARPLM